MRLCLKSCSKRAVVTGHTCIRDYCALSSSNLVTGKDWNQFTGFACQWSSVNTDGARPTFCYILIFLDFLKAWSTLLLQWARILQDPQDIWQIFPFKMLFCLPGICSFLTYNYLVLKWCHLGFCIKYFVLLIFPPNYLTREFLEIWVFKCRKFHYLPRVGVHLEDSDSYWFCCFFLDHWSGK